MATQYWTCSCKGCIHRGICKHLKRFGLNGRAVGADHPSNRVTYRELAGIPHVEKPDPIAASFRMPDPPKKTPKVQIQTMPPKKLEPAKRVWTDDDTNAALAALAEE